MLRPAVDLQDFQPSLVADGFTAPHGAQIKHQHAVVGQDDNVVRQNVLQSDSQNYQILIPIACLVSNVRQP